MEQVRLGILGPGRIVGRVMKDFNKAKGITLTAVASRSLARAQEAAKRYGAKYAFGSYEELARCGEVDLVYVATPHNFHCEHSILMMEHGKHVLCEKPASVSAEETERMIRSAKKNSVFFMEAMWTRCFPASQKLLELVKAGAIGKAVHIYAEFAFSGLPDREDRLLNPALAGGALLDLGIYPLMAATQLLGYRPVRVEGLCSYAETGVDLRDAFTLQYEDGAMAQLACGMDMAGRSYEIVYGTKGRIEVEDFWHPTSFTMVKADGSREEFSFGTEDEGYHHEFTHAAACVRNGILESPLVTWEESLEVSKLLTGLRRQWGVNYPWEAKTGIR